MLTSLLISWFGKRAGVVLAKVLPYALVMLLVVGGGWLLYDNGYDSGVEETERKYQVVIEQERHRQIEANNAALEEARRRYAELERLLDEREATITDLLQEGAEDPDADRRAIGTGSVQRINRIR